MEAHEGFKKGFALPIRAVMLSFFGEFVNTLDLLSRIILSGIYHG